jgi:hypothetical protein
LNTAASVIEVDSKKGFVFDLVTEKRHYRFSGTSTLYLSELFALFANTDLFHILAYNSDEYEAWISGFNNLLTAMKYPTPFDFKNCSVIERVVHSYRPYEMVLFFFLSAKFTFGDFME